MRSGLSGKSQTPLLDWKLPYWERRNPRSPIDSPVAPAGDQNLYTEAHGVHASTVKSTISMRRSPPDDYGTRKLPHAVRTCVILFSPQKRQGEIAKTRRLETKSMTRKTHRAVSAIRRKGETWWRQGTVQSIVNRHICRRTLLYRKSVDVRALSVRMRTPLIVYSSRGFFFQEQCRNL